MPYTRPSETQHTSNTASSTRATSRRKPTIKHLNHCWELVRALTLLNQRESALPALTFALVCMCDASREVGGGMDGWLRPLLLTRIALVPPTQAPLAVPAVRHRHRHRNTGIDTSASETTASGGCARGMMTQMTRACLVREKNQAEHILSSINRSCEREHA
jgi:hypothetical protein